MPSLLVGDIPFTFHGIRGKARSRLIRTLEGSVAEAGDLLAHALSENGDVTVAAISADRPHVLATAIRLNEDYVRSERVFAFLGGLGLALAAAFVAVMNQVSRPGHDALLDLLVLVTMTSAWLSCMLAAFKGYRYLRDRGSPVGETPARKLLGMHASGVAAGRDRLYHWSPAPSGAQHLRQIHYDAVGACLRHLDGVSIHALDGKNSIHVPSVSAPDATSFVAYVKERTERARRSAPTVQGSSR